MPKRFPTRSCIPSRPAVTASRWKSPTSSPRSSPASSDDRKQTLLQRQEQAPMHLMYFTEQPMSAYSEQAGRDFGATALMFPNTHFDPAEGSRLYNEYIEQYQLAEAVG